MEESRIYKHLIWKFCVSLVLSDRNEIDQSEYDLIVINVIRSHSICTGVRTTTFNP
jgi:hypothetical protein